MAAAEEGDVVGDGEEAEAPSEGREALLAVARLLPINELVAKIIVVFVNLPFQMSCLCTVKPCGAFSLCVQCVSFEWHAVFIVSIPKVSELS